MATKHNGKGLSLTIDGVQFNADGTSVLMDNEDAEGDTTTFADLDEGTPSQWFFQLTCLTNPDTNSFWSMLWDNAGSDDLAFVFQPFGVGVGKVKFTGTCKVLRKPGVGGDAGTDWTNEARLDIDGTPTKALQT